MKVEFKNTVLGDVLCVEKKEFQLAQVLNEEYDSLNSAVYAFYSTFCFVYNLEEAVYDLIWSNIGRHGKVIFSVGSSEDDTRKYPEIYILSNNKLKKIFSDNE